MTEPIADASRAAAGSAASSKGTARTLPMAVALVGVATVWLLGCAWSYQEQAAFAESKRFAFPHLLPLVIDGFAVAMAGVAWAASLDARPAVAARLATVIAVAGSAASNGAWAWIRSQHDLATVALATAVPVAANVAFEVLLAELRRQVQRRRGEPPPVAIPHPRLVRFVLAPRRTWAEWRALVLTLTAPSAPGTDRIEPTRTPIDRQPHARAVEAAPPPGPSPGAEPGGRAERPDPTTAAAARVSESHVERRPARAAAGTPAQPRPMIGDRRLDDRAIALAVKLDKLDDPDAVTGDAVGELLGLDLAPRTGRRLLGQARALRKAESRPPVAVGT